MQTQKIRAKKILLIPDIHFPEQDDKALSIVKKVLSIDKFDEIIQLGDMLDMYSLSTFTKDPEKMAKGLKEELELAKSFIRYVRKTQPKAKITLLKGNHEARFEKYIFEKAPGLAHLIDYRKMLDLDDRTKYLDGIYTLGKLHFMHGVKVASESAFSARQHFISYNMSMVIGHTHRMGTYYKTNLDTTFRVDELGCLCKLDPDYTKDRGVTNWQQGFGVVYIEPKSGWFMLVPFPIVNGKTIYKDKLIGG